MKRKEQRYDTEVSPNREKRRADVENRYDELLTKALLRKEQQKRFGRTAG